MYQQTNKETQKIMETLRLELYNQIELLEAKLINSNSNEYGFSEDNANVSEQISELETKISETWSK